MSAQLQVLRRCKSQRPQLQRAGRPRRPRKLAARRRPPSRRGRRRFRRRFRPCSRRGPRAQTRPPRCHRASARRARPTLKSTVAATRSASAPPRRSAWGAPARCSATHFSGPCRTSRSAALLAGARFLRQRGRRRWRPPRTRLQFRLRSPPWYQRPCLPGRHLVLRASPRARQPQPRQRRRGPRPPPPPSPPSP